MLTNVRVQPPVSFIRAFVFVSLACLLLLAQAAAPSQAKTIGVPADYASIQEAINHSARGDTIIVDSGTYAENVVIDRAVTVTSRDTGNGLPVVDGQGKNGITIKVGSVTLRGFRVTNANYGIHVSCDSQNAANYNNVLGNTVSDSCYGILAAGFVNLVGNTADNNKYSGIKVSTTGADVTGNTANNNGDDGFLIYCSYNTNVAGNTANNNGLYGVLVTGPWCHDNLVTGNTAEKNQNGIGISECTNVTLKGNTASNNDFAGIYLLNDARNNILSGNTANNNEYVGICFDNTENILDNVVTGNTVYNNPRGGVCIQPYSSFGYELNGPQYSTDFSRGGNIVSDNNADNPGPAGTPVVSTPAAGTPAASATTNATAQPATVSGTPKTGSNQSVSVVLLSLMLTGVALHGIHRHGKRGRQ